MVIQGILLFYGPLRRVVSKTSLALKGSLTQGTCDTSDFVILRSSGQLRKKRTSAKLILFAKTSHPDWVGSWRPNPHSIHTGESECMAVLAISFSDHTPPPLVVNGNFVALPLFDAVRPHPLPGLTSSFFCRAASWVLRTPRLCLSPFAFSRCPSASWVDSAILYGFFIVFLP